MKNTWTFDLTKLRTCRELLGLSPQRLGAAIGKTGQAIRNWERGMGSPTVTDLVRMANAFCVTPQSFFKQVPAKPVRTA